MKVFNYLFIYQRSQYPLALHGYTITCRPDRNCRVRYATCGQTWTRSETSWTRSRREGRTCSAPCPRPTPRCRPGRPSSSQKARTELRSSRRESTSHIDLMPNWVVGFFWYLFGGWGWGGGLLCFRFF